MKLKLKMLYQEIENKQEKLRVKEQLFGDDFTSFHLNIGVKIKIFYYSYKGSILNF
jgi:hypothetical protein